MSTPNTSIAALLVELLQDAREPIQSPAHLARLTPELLDHLHTKAVDLHHHAVSEARDLLDVVLESIEHSLPPEHLRRLIERVDDELGIAQRWNELAVNAQFCWKHPELAQQLVSDMTLDTAASRSEEKYREPPRRRTKQETSIGA